MENQLARLTALDRVAIYERLATQDHDVCLSFGEIGSARFQFSLIASTSTLSIYILMSDLRRVTLLLAN